MEAGKRQQAFANGSCSRLFRVFAGQEVKYLEHNDGGSPVSQQQSSCFTKGLFFPPEDGLPHGEILAVLPSALLGTVNINFPQIKRKQVQVI